MARTQAQRRADTRDRLLQSAAARFAADGVERASIDAIADDAERTSGSVYAHFGSKEGLLLALLLDSWKNDMVVAATAEVSAAATAEERLAAIWRNFADPPGDGGRWLQLEHELWLYATRHPDVLERLTPRYRDVWRETRDELREWQATGEIDPPVPDDALAPLLVALLIGLEMQHRLDPDAIDERLAIAGLAALLGVARPTGAAREAEPTAERRSRRRPTRREQ